MADEAQAGAASPRGGPAALSRVVDLVAPRASEDLAQLRTALDVAAAENARLHAAARRRARWTEVTAGLGSAVLTDDPLPLLARTAQEAAGADEALLLVPEGARARGVATSAQPGAAGRSLPLSSALGAALGGDRAVPLDPDGDATAGSALAVGLGTPDGTRLVLLLSRRPGQRPFDADDLGLATAFARHAETALQLRDAERRARLRDLLADRERIGAELQHSVVAELFGVGLVLSSVQGRVRDPLVQAVLAEQVVALDRAVRALRRSVFEGLERPAAVDWRSRVADVVHEAAGALGHVPRLEVTGCWDDVPPPRAQELLAVLRETLTTVAGLGTAGATTVSVLREPDCLGLVVAVDGPAAEAPRATTRIAWRTSL